MSKKIVILGLILFALTLTNCNSHSVTDMVNLEVTKTDSLPLVFPDNKSDIIDKQLRYEAALKFAEQQLPSTMKEWEDYSTKLRNEVINKAGVRD